MSACFWSNSRYNFATDLTEVSLNCIVKCCRFILNRHFHFLAYRLFLECSTSVGGSWEMIRNSILQTSVDDGRRKITRVRKRKHIEMIESPNSHSTVEDERTALEKEHEEVG